MPKIKSAPWVRTPSGCLHVAYRRESVPPGNTKLAERLVPDPTKKTGCRKDTLIETRGEGGYIVAVGSPADCHEDNKPYVLISGNFAELPVLTDAEIDIVYEIARSFDQLPKAPPKEKKPATERTGGRPGDDFAAKTSWSEILEPHDWVLAYTDSRGVAHWRRPGKTDLGTSATTNYGGSDLLYVFSTNADPFEDGRSYSKFAAYAQLEHVGDFSAAAAALAKRSFGSKASGGDGSTKETPETPPIPLELPETALRGIYAAYRECMRGTTEASDTAHFMTLWSIVAARLRRLVWFPQGRPVYPNGYLIFYGPTGDAKTTAERMALSLAGPVAINACKGSTEGIADWLALQEGPYLFFLEEFCSLLT